MNKRIIYCVVVFLLVGCIDEYKPESTAGLTNLLVVEGHITDQESVFKLSRSISLEDYFLSDMTIDNASVYVEKDNGERLSGVFRGEGVYTVQTGKLEKERQYRLCIKVDGREYQSGFLSPLFTPEIDSVTTYKKASGEPVQIYVFTHDSEERSRYYRWTYREIWEITAELYANSGYLNPEDLNPGDEDIIFYDDKKNTYYCWVQDSSGHLILGSSEKLSENVIYRQKIAEIPSDNDRLSELYCMELKQNQIRREAYDYFLNLQKNIEQTGDVFSAIPSELKGNIYCVTDPDIPVIGFCDVTTTTRKILYIPFTMYYYEPTSVKLCYDEITLDSLLPGYTLYGYYQVSTSDPPLYRKEYAPRQCVDCRLLPRATKNRPDFWPNDHY